VSRTNRILLILVICTLLLVAAIATAFAFPSMGSPADQNNAACQSCHGQGKSPGPSPAANPDSTPSKTTPTTATPTTTAPTTTAPTTTAPTTVSGTGNYTLKFGANSVKINAVKTGAVLLIPVRDTANLFGARVIWDNNTKTATVNTFVIGSDQTRIIQDRLYAPTNTLAQAFRSNVEVTGTTITFTPLKVRTEKPIDSSSCASCHTEVNTLWKRGVHKDNLNCVDCHSGVNDHLAKPSAATKPATDLSLANCGTCHEDQYNSFWTINYNKSPRQEKANFTSKAPAVFWEVLMMGHGFTREHNVQRSHAFMNIDHLIVDRAYGGRFQPAAGWAYLGITQPENMWDHLVDTVGGENQPHRPYMKGTAAAANPVCMNCKTQDHVLNWKYMGDPDPRAKWDRTSNPADFVKDVKHPMNCYTCHDPHSNEPRIIRDGLIQALTRPEADTVWHKDPKRTNFEVINFRNDPVLGAFRKIAILEKSDSKLTCGQCHVEYNCNSGTTFDRKRITMADQRTNHFPFKNVMDLDQHYRDLDFVDWWHPITDAPLIKMQHPEAETYWNSKHDKLGIGCDACHMPKVKNAAGKVYTSHWQTNPKEYLKETCLQCHTDWNEKQAKYVIEGIKNYNYGKLRKAEFWLTRMIDRFELAKTFYEIPPDLHDLVRKEHRAAHTHWEYWTAETSAGFHNMQLARESMMTSIEHSQRALKAIDEFLVKQKTKN